jgi:hypothetical protein
MLSSKTRIRKNFEPLTVAISVYCTSPASPLTQTFNGYNSEYEPNRQLTPTVIYPDVVASASDGSWSDTDVNSLLANIQWLVDGKDITTDSTWATYYEILTTGSDRGTIKIYKNVPPGTTYRLQFKATLSDTRLGVNIPILSDEIILSTSEKSDDSFSLAIKDGNVIEYDPLKDMHALYEYLIAHGISAQDSEVGSYQHTIPITLFKGTTALDASEYTISVFRVESDGSLTRLGPPTSEVLAFSPTYIIMDFRLIEQADYIVKAYSQGKEVASLQYSVNRVYQAYTIRPTNGTDIHPTDKQRYDEAMVSADGNIVEYPGRIFRILWYTDSASNHGCSHNEGDTTLFNLDKTGIGDTADDCYLDVYCTSEYKEPYQVATDDSGEVLVDENNNVLIFN